MSTHPTAAEVRRQFLEFFAQREHRIVPSGPVFPSDDPTLLFTNAGMNQFKDVFLGTGSRDYKRAVDTQKCIRVSGKHNDLEEVGVDTYHHTFFEMLGNWSFGDYFKREAIRWAWELLTDVWGLPKDRLWVTVFEGNRADGLDADEEAAQLWREETDIDPSRILPFGKEDNFWEMGETGPCGPCSEIHLDRGPEGCNFEDGRDPKLGVNAGNERFIELWNLVFMQFNRQDDGSLVELPAKSVDTGMGFERVLSVLQGKLSNYDTDLFGPIFEALGGLCGRPYGASDSREDVAFRVVADHVRAVSSAFGDGALPSNTGRGYVLRRLIRRAARFGRQDLGLEEPFLWRLVGVVSEVLGETFPEIPARQEHIELLIRSEEEAFAKTLGRGLTRFAELAGSLEAGQKRLPGAEAFELYATYGFPRDLVELMARERGLELDGAGWGEAEGRHAEASRSDGQFKTLLSPEQLAGLEETESTYHQEGESSLTGEGRLLRVVSHSDGRVVAVLDRSPFYAESGGQVGDCGVIESTDGAFKLEVLDTQKLGGVVAHVGRAAGVAAEGAAVVARVDGDRRGHIRRNHTATHLLHKALREVLGEHVTQAGSYVGPDRLRFDFSHPKGLSSEELAEVERRVAGDVLENSVLRSAVEDLESAKARGAMALFGEKYADRVRVVEVGRGSVELCGGTHVNASGDIGPFLIVTERAIQAGVRRIEAVTGHGALVAIQASRRQLDEASRTLKVAPEELNERIATLQKQVKEAKRAGAAAAKSDLGGVLKEIEAGLSDRDGVQVGAFDLPALGQAALREIGGQAKRLAPDLCVALFGREKGRVPFLVLCQGQALGAGLDAGKLAGVVRERLGGGGGGKPDSAQGAGADPGQMEAALEAVREAIGQAR